MSERNRTFKLSPMCGLALLVIAPMAANPLIAGPAMAQVAPGMSAEEYAAERAAIIQMFNWTMIAFDNRDFAEFLDHFAQHGVFEVLDADRSQNVRMTRDQMLERFLGRPAEISPDRHFTSNISIVFASPTEATLNGNTAWMRANESGGFSAADISSYDISLVKQDGRWVFSRYQLLHSGAGDGRSPLATP